MVNKFSATISTSFLKLSLSHFGCVYKFVLLKFSAVCFYFDIIVRCYVFFWVRSHVNGEIEKDLNDAQYMPIRQTHKCGVSVRCSMCENGHGNSTSHILCMQSD